jgi:RNA polymerase sigma-70 factor, ECF subfamily
VTQRKQGTEAAGGTALERHIQEHLGGMLRAHYDAELDSGGLPDRIRKLIEELERRAPAPKPVPPDIRDALLAAIPSLRAFAISLSNSPDRADDLVQDTIMRAWKNIDRFEPGTNLNAWLFTILRNLFHSEYRKRRREVEDSDGSYAASLKVAPEQVAKLDFQDMRTALAKLSHDQREALLLVGAEGLPYEEAARICGVAVGTIKSRVNRARSRLSQLLGIEDEEELGPDRVMKAALRTD